MVASATVSLTPSRTPHIATGAESPALTVQLLGTFRVRLGDRVIDDAAWRLRPAAGLVKLLSLAPQHRLHREQLLEWLWPEATPSAAVSALHQALYAARRAIQPDVTRATASTYLCLTRDLLSLRASGGVFTDVERFELEAEAARKEATLSRYQAAIGLYEGELLPENRYTEWTLSRRESLRALWHTLLFNMAALLERKGDPEAAAGALQRVLADEPAHEEAQAGLIRLYDAMGRRHEAIRQYQVLRQSLHHELRATPSHETQQLYERILAGSDVPAPATHGEALPAPQKNHSRPRHNLPAPLTSFIGREQERADLVSLLTGEPPAARLVTLCGSGGCGKTRLALDVAHTLVQRDPSPFDEVRLVELAALSNPALVAAAVAAALNLPETPDGDETPLDALAQRLHGRRLLLVLDNCEHLLDACAALADHLLRACPELRMLATSREPLGVTGEMVYEVPPLPVPAGEGTLPPDALLHYAAVQLFVERARLRQPEFALTAENAGDVARMCRRLDGFPLAIELAAGRLRALSLDQIAGQMENRFRLLVGGSRGAAPRQQTLWATVQWSYELLSPEEQDTFRRLSVFSGGWTLEAAEAVRARSPAPGAGVGVGDVLHRLSQLVEKSLVVRHERPGSVRYSLLETLREFGAQRLREAGEETATRTIHQDWYLRLAESTVPECHGNRQQEALDRLEREHDNLCAALQWSVTGSGTLETGLRLGAALAWFWFVRGPRREGWSHLSALLDMAQRSAAPPAWQQAALAGLGLVCLALGDFGAGRAHLRESLTLARGLGDARRLAGVLALHIHLASTLGTHRNRQEQTMLAEECLALGQDLWDDGIVAEALAWQALIAREQGEYKGALALGEESLLLSRARGDLWGMARTLRLLGETARLEGNHELAVAHTEERLALARAVSDDVAVAHALQVLGELALVQGALVKATELLDESVALRRLLGDSRQFADGLHHRAWVALRAGDLAGAAMRFEENLEYAAARAQTLRVAQCLVGMAKVAQLGGDNQWAATLLGAVEAMSTDLERLYPHGYDLLSVLSRVLAARATLRDEEHATAWDAGRALHWRDAVQLAKRRTGI